MVQLTLRQLGPQLVVLTSVLLASQAAAAEDFTQIGKPLGKFRNTYYYSVQESDYAHEPRTESMLAMDGSVLVKVGNEFKKAICIEGSGKLLDGRVINFFGRVNREARWHFTQHQHGRGLGDCALVPFHTIAVDPTMIPPGSLVSIDETVGMRLPDGSIHDGLWRAEDMGSAIQKDRIDLFVGDGESQGAYLNAHGIHHLQALQVRWVSGPDQPSCVDQTPTWPAWPTW